MLYIKHDKSKNKERKKKKKRKPVYVELPE